MASPFTAGLCVTGPLYAGSVAADGSVGYLPAGWSVAHTGVGTYRVTHNLNLPQGKVYEVYGTSGAGTKSVVSPSNYGATSFDVNTLLFPAGNNADLAFGFLAMQMG